ncbi:MAG: RNA-directed DNA polymerase, partial [Candidatus Omnitrophica bacterium]|nr:RNA-directed DNA polymerase [Candidatus Omnitrophota bacterium]
VKFFNKGLPIGNLTSQLFANMYLHEVDMFVKHVLREKYYLRYMDDMMIFSDDRQWLLNMKLKVEKFLKEHLFLELHKGKSQVFDTKKGFNFLGFRMSQRRRRLCSDNVIRLRKRLNVFEEMLKNKTKSEEKVRDSIRCWSAHASYGHTKRLFNSICKSMVKKGMRTGRIMKKIFPPT